MSKLQDFRKTKGLSQMELAKYSNVSIQMVQKLEQNKMIIENCHIDTLLKFSEILGCRFYELFDDEVLSRRVRLQLFAPSVQGAER